MGIVGERPIPPPAGSSALVICQQPTCHRPRNGFRTRSRFLTAGRMVGTLAFLLQWQLRSMQSHGGHNPRRSRATGTRQRLPGCSTPELTCGQHAQRLAVPKPAVFNLQCAGQSSNSLSSAMSAPLAVLPGLAAIMRLAALEGLPAAQCVSPVLTGRS